LPISAGSGGAGSSGSGAGKSNPGLLASCKECKPKSDNYECCQCHGFQCAADGDKCVTTTPASGCTSLHAIVSVDVGYWTQQGQDCNYVGGCSSSETADWCGAATSYPVTESGSTLSPDPGICGSSPANVIHCGAINWRSTGPGTWVWAFTLQMPVSGTILAMDYYGPSGTSATPDVSPDGDYNMHGTNPTSPPAGCASPVATWPDVITVHTGHS
jgi:hypothetical protein